MPQKSIYICQDCKSEWDIDSANFTKSCKSCGSNKVYKSHYHQRAAKKSRNKERWSYRVK
jgi:DNA-directed RNA polymerase subunit RPC12/RpoP